MANLIGQSIGRYHILEQLGEGGMATVYKAFDTRLERDVAVKVIRRAAFPPEQLDHILKRFEREAKALAKLSHPNIVGIIDYGEYEGSPYLVMEFLPSGTLTQYLGKPVPWPEAARLLLPVARALQFAHGKGIIHRDIKPANILITDSGEPMLSDFGIAKILESEETTNLTGTGFGVGTPAYMAPEQWTGKVVPQSDIYSLGVVLYEMVTGRKPYVADTPSAVMLKQATEPLPRPKTYVPDLPDSVEKVLLKALARKPEDRYREMAGFVDSLENVLIGQPKGKKQIGVKPVVETQATFLQKDLPANRIRGAVRRSEEEAGPSAKRKNGGWRWVAIGAGLIGLIMIGVVGVRSYFPAPSPTVTIAPTFSPITTFVPTRTPFPQFPIYQNIPFPKSLPPITADNAQEIIPLVRLGEGVLAQVAWSPDGGTLAMASSTGIYFYDAAVKEQTRFIQTDAGVQFVSFSPDGTLLAGSMGDYSVRLWRVSDGSLLRTMEGHSHVMTGVAFSPDGTILASSSWDGLVQLWKVSDGALLRTLKGHSCGVTSVAFSPDGESLASGSCDKTIRLWRISDGTVLRVFSGHSDYVISVAISPDGSLLASGSFDKTVRLWRISDGATAHILNGHTNWVYSVAFSNDGEMVASGSMDYTIQLWRTSDGTPEKTLKGHTGTVLNIAFSPDGKTLASAGSDRVVRLWQIPDGTPIHVFEEHANAYSTAAFSPDETLLAIGGSPTMSVTLLRISDGAVLQSLSGHTSPVTSVAFSNDGTMLASGSWDMTARIWKTADGSTRNILSGHTGGVTSVAFSPDGVILATGSYDNTIRLWQVSDGTLLNTLEGHTDRVDSVVFSPDGTLLASGSKDKTIRIWRIADGTPVRSLNGQGWICAVAFSPDGSLIASGADDKIIRIWRVSDGYQLFTLTSHTNRVTDVEFSPDGSLIASASWDTTLQLTRVKDGELVRTLKGHMTMLYGTAFSSRGSMLASYSSDGTIRLWGIIP